MLRPPSDEQAAVDDHDFEVALLCLKPPRRSRFWAAADISLTLGVFFFGIPCTIAATGATLGTLFTIPFPTMLGSLFAGAIFFGPLVYFLFYKPLLITTETRKVLDEGRPVVGTITEDRFSDWATRGDPHAYTIEFVDPSGQRRSMSCSMIFRSDLPRYSSRTCTLLWHPLYPGRTVAFSLNLHRLGGDYGRIFELDDLTRNRLLTMKQPVRNHRQAEAERERMPHSPAPAEGAPTRSAHVETRVIAGRVPHPSSFKAPAEGAPTRSTPMAATVIPGRATAAPSSPALVQGSFPWLVDRCLRIVRSSGDPVDPADLDLTVSQSLRALARLIGVLGVLCALPIVLGSLTGIAADPGGPHGVASPWVGHQLAVLAGSLVLWSLFAPVLAVVDREVMKQPGLLRHKEIRPTPGIRLRPDSELFTFRRLLAAEVMASPCLLLWVLSVVPVLKLFVTPIFLAGCCYLRWMALKAFLEDEFHGQLKALEAKLTRILVGSFIGGLLVASVPAAIVGVLHVALNDLKLPPAFGNPAYPVRQERPEAGRATAAPAPVRTVPVTSSRTVPVTSGRTAPTKGRFLVWQQLAERGGFNVIVAADGALPASARAALGAPEKALFRTASDHDLHVVRETFVKDRPTFLVCARPGVVLNPPPDSERAMLQGSFNALLHGDLANQLRTITPELAHPVEVLGKPQLTGVRILFRPGIRKAATLVLMGAACYAPVKLLPDSGGKLRYVVGAR